jgi:hypothetical protein
MRRGRGEAAALTLSPFSSLEKQLLAVVDCVCYGIWSFLGTTSSLWYAFSLPRSLSKLTRPFPSSGAESTASDLGVDLSSYLQCDAQWMQYLLWGLVCVSGSLQPSVATSAIGGGGGSANELGRKRRRGTSSVTSPAVSYAPPAAQPGTSTVARSLGRKQSRSSRRPKRETKAREVEDEEAELPLQREEYGRVVEERSEEWSSEERDGRAEYGEGRRKEKGRSSKWSAA